MVCFREFQVEHLCRTKASAVINFAQGVAFPQAQGRQKPLGSQVRMSPRFLRSLKSRERLLRHRPSRQLNLRTIENPPSAPCQ